MRQQFGDNAEMTPPLTGEEIADWLREHRKTARWLAETLGVAGSTPTRWIKGAAIPEPMDKLLRLLLRGEVPFGLLPDRARSVLEFTPAEWRVIEVLRVREGFESAHAWITAKIRAYLAMSSTLGQPQICVAEAEPEYGERKEDG